MSDEERDLRKYSRRSAIGLMGVGGGLAATETLGFTNVTAGRDAFIGIDGDGDAILESTGSSEEGGVDDEPLSELEDDDVDDDLTIEFTNRSDVTLEAGSDDLAVKINETANNKLDVSTTNFDSETDIEAGEGQTYNIDSNLDTNDNASIELTNNDGDSATIDVEVDAVFNGTALNLTRDDITIVDTLD